MSNDRSQRIAELNDAFRRNLLGGTILLTSGVKALSDHVRSELIMKVRSVNTFELENDPYQEHDFGTVEVGVQKFFWKIDYYDLNMQYGSEDSADATKTKRVLTIMKAEEY